MSPEALLKADGIYDGQASIAGIPCSIGYIKKFKWSWMGTQLNTFIIIGDTPDTITQTLINQFSAAGFQYALDHNKGWPKGLQSAVGAICILRGPSVDGTAIHYCEHQLKKHWSAFELPVVYNTTENKGYRYKNAPLWGAIYFPYFAQTIDTLLAKMG